MLSLEKQPNLAPRAQEVLDELLEGNRRFRTGQSTHYTYTPNDLHDIAHKQHPIAAVVACSDSRVVPEIFFDQPLGSLFVSRVPGNVASDGTKWMLEIAIQEFNVPLVLVIGHTGCMAIGQLLERDKGGPGGSLRYAVQSAISRAKNKRPVDLYDEAIKENIRQSIDHLTRESFAIGVAIRDHRTTCLGAIYDMPSGAVNLIE